MASVKCQPLQEIIVDVLFRGDLSKLPGTWYIGLGTGALPASDAAMAAVTEVTGPGYGRMAVTRDSTGFPLKTLAAAVWKVVSLTRHFAATGLWTPADYLFLTDNATPGLGKLYAAGTVDEPFLLRAGETWDGVFEYAESS